jgi:nitrite reductase (cytochrome c-552)
MNTTTTSATHQRRRPSSKRIAKLLLFGVLTVAVLATVAVTFTLVTMFERKQEARSPYLRVVDLNETSTIPRPGA